MQFCFFSAYFNLYYQYLEYHAMNQCNGIFMSILEKLFFAAVSKIAIRSALCQMVTTSVR